MGQPENPERDGFQITKKPFTQPQNTGLLDAGVKRKVTICNLFANHQLAIADIVRVLDEKYERVVNVLIEQGLINDRRKKPRGSRKDSGRSLFKRR